ncbi:MULTISPECIES: hypothetical protein [Burkholderia cepacia complex]|uniref:hypothetical protein n=1 Tax=Burkholderia cepacia complex TaxID=87882 RepID=UPI000AD3DFA3|nr:MULTISPECIES: hypothetical protein [Burkholderia cepacia complex]UJH77459.1 hypothetical protein L0U95_22535 [Burkholderia cenocepacia]
MRIKFRGQQNRRDKLTLGKRAPDRGRQIAVPQKRDHKPGTMKNDPRVAHYPMLTREQHVFASAWYNMTYAYSLDSHRVRVMNGVNILEELIRLNGLAHASKEDRWIVAREAILILEAEAVLKRPAFAASVKRVCAEIDRSYGKALDKSSGEWSVLLDSYLREHMYLLERCYLEETIAAIHTAVTTPDARPEPERFDEIRSLTGSLLSFLIARGRSLEGLFQLYSHVLVPIHKPVKPYQFARRFDFLRKLITDGEEEWDVWFAINGVTDAATFPNQIGTIKFHQATPAGIAKLDGSMRPHGRRLFANDTAQAVDMRSAGQLVHERINRVLDLVRFEYDRSNIAVSDGFALGQPPGGLYRMMPIPKVVPNPQTSLTAQELNVFAQNVGALVSDDRFSPEGRDRVLSAFRLYRTGADTTNFENKLVNWWTAFEFLGKGGLGSGGIGKAVEKSVTPILMGVSVINHLMAYRELLLEQKVNLVDATTAQAIALKDLNLPQLYDVLSTPAHQATIHAALNGLPFAQRRCDQFMAVLTQPKDMGTFLERTETGLRWHLQRVYRARCDIVHSAGRMINIALLCANLEAYLKSVLTALLAAFGSVPTLGSPQEFFLRAERSYLNASVALKDSDAGPLKAFLVELRPPAA